ncbi:hypothetical protein Pint_17169 [Pistacia integerrima]|uniref:Uncharacterized protein n=1 Tax=Pistacia integerrima TaxID=434235 RepID=A0ACC0YZ41_9ROSI|nr:hypothetical protein Pint_17169 [Pistacia integerrima]
MARKVASGGQERFQRKHNADGAMEYWLESADLVDIRKEAGVEDPYWILMLAWSLGDNLTQDPVSAVWSSSCSRKPWPKWKGYCVPAAC